WALTQPSTGSLSFLAGRTQAYTYDPAGIGNLTTVTGTESTTGVSLAVPAETDSYALPQPHAITAMSSGPGSGAYAYDDRGRQVSSPARASVQYNSTDRPTSIASAAGDTLT